MSSVQEVLDRYADGTQYEKTASTLLDGDRWSGNPVVLLADAAASSTGQDYFAGVRPTVERFRETFVDGGRVESFTDLAALSAEDEDLVDVFGAERKRRVLLDGARVFADRPESGLEAVEAWAAEAILYRYQTDPIGEISGVGPSTFQYLRQLAGVDVAKPDRELDELIETVASEVDSPYLDASESLRAVASCEWMAIVSSYRAIEIDQIAWWNFADEADREAAIELYE